MTGCSDIFNIANEYLDAGRSDIFKVNFLFGIHDHKI